jgi:hypothetical protein
MGRPDVEIPAGFAGSEAGREVDDNEKGFSIII